MRKHFVSKYKYSHDARRKQFRRWAKDGLVKLLEKSRDGFLYEEMAEIPITVKNSSRGFKFSIDKGLANVQTNEANNNNGKATK